MTQDQSDQIEELLISWHRWQDSYTPALGAPRCSPTCREYEIPAKHQTDQERSEAVDAKLFKRNGETVDACVDALPRWEHRASIQMSMSNKRAGYSVFSNARLSAEESHRFYQESKKLLLPKFMARGLIKILEAA
jgi:hypothetical protein